MSTKKLGQIKELLALTLLGALSSVSSYLLLKDASQGFIAKHGNPIIDAYYNFANVSHHPLNVLAIFVVPTLWLLALLTSPWAALCRPGFGFMADERVLNRRLKFRL